MAGLTMLSNPFALNQKTTEERPKEFLWVNVGFKMVNSKGEEVLVTLPVNLGVGLMKPKELVNGKTEKQQEYQEQIIAQNLILELLQQRGAELGDGEAVIIPTAVVELRRVAASSKEVAVNTVEGIRKAVTAAVMGNGKKK